MPGIRRSDLNVAVCNKDLFVRWIYSNPGCLNLIKCYQVSILNGDRLLSCVREFTSLAALGSLRRPRADPP